MGGRGYSAEAVTVFWIEECCCAPSSSRATRRSKCAGCPDDVANALRRVHSRLYLSRQSPSPGRPSRRGTRHQGRVSMSPTSSRAPAHWTPGRQISRPRKDEAIAITSQDTDDRDMLTGCADLVRNATPMSPSSPARRHPISAPDRPRYGLTLRGHACATVGASCHRLSQVGSKSICDQTMTIQAPFVSDRNVGLSSGDNTHGNPSGSCS